MLSTATLDGFEEGVLVVVISKTVNGLAVSWYRCGICVPELSLEELTAWIVEVACIWQGSSDGTT